ncbi:MAG: chorismate synthase, partial [Planctomycetota bacterium]
MPGNTFGSLFQITTFGESHGPAVGCVIDGCPPGIAIDLSQVQAALTRRRPGQSKLVTPRDEADQVEALSGLDLESGRSLGTPIALVVRNQDQRSRSYGDWHHIYRPSHADFGYDAKYGLRAWQGGGRSSARETIGRVAAGDIARQALLSRFADLHITAWVESVHDISLPADFDALAVINDQVEAHPTRCPDPATAARMEDAILKA